MNEQLSTTHAHISLARLCGCNYKMPVRRAGKSVYVTDPQGTHEYRLSAAKFDAGEYQYRDSWVIVPWSAKAERIAKSEANWQD